MKPMYDKYGSEGLTKGATRGGGKSERHTGGAEWEREKPKKDFQDLLSEILLIFSKRFLSDPIL